MRTVRYVSMIGVALFGLSGVARAHKGPVFVAQQVDPATITIDGLGDDPGWNPPFWDDKNTITTEELGGDALKGHMPPLDDWRVSLKVGWSAPPDNMLYFYAQVTDDILNDEAFRPGGNGVYWQDDSMGLVVDANHDGGQFNYIDVPPSGTIGQEFAIRMAEGAPHWIAAGPREWTAQSPYMDVAVELPVGKTNVTYAYEGKAALWDRAEDTPEVSQRHENAEKQVLGLTFMWNDADAKPNVRDHQPSTQGPSGPNAWKNADDVSDFRLVDGPAVPRTAVEASAWGAIKATFQK